MNNRPVNRRGIGGKSLARLRGDREKSSENFIYLFAQQVKANPSTVLVASGIQKITYSEIDKRSDAVANRLRMNGIKKGQLVGLCSSLDIDFVTCMLGVIKSGGVYFPLDPTYPQSRLNYMLRDGKPSIILAQKQFFNLFQNYNILAIEEPLFEGTGTLEQARIEIYPEDLAYVIYTSGSTGNPKGIMVTHGSLPNVATAHRAYYPPNIKMLISGGVCFDASLLVIFHALINGSPIHLFDYNPKEPAGKLLDFIKSNAIEYMICVPSHYLKLLQENCKLPSLKCVSLTGENLPSSLSSLHSELAPNAVLYNEYGPSECAIGTTIAEIYNPQTKTIRKVTVGKPLPNTRVYILDANQKEVPVGVKGEIYVSGVGLAKGYLNNEPLTDQRFVRLRLSGNKSLRLYRTGDYGRFLEDGELEFLGRIEQRVQICGNWVDLGEIEHYISCCPAVKESAILVRHSPREKIVAYVTAVKKRSVKNVLVRYLENFLPKQMIPSDIIQIDRFPCSPNGKIDRDALLLRNG